MAGAMSTAELYKLINRQQNQLDILQARFDKLADSFCLYYFDERKPPCFGIVLEKGIVRVGEHKGRTSAKIKIFTEHLSGGGEVRFDKLLLDENDKNKDGSWNKAGRWEPLILPQAMFKEAINLLDEKEPEGDVNTALVA